MHKTTNPVFSEVITQLKENVHPTTGMSSPLVADNIYDIVMTNKEWFDSSIMHDRDYAYGYFGYKTLERSYLFKIKNKIVERPQHMIMRVAVGIHGDNLEKVKETYQFMSDRYFTHATPTLFNAGTPRPQLSSCFLLTMKDDSIEGIYDTLKQVRSDEEGKTRATTLRKRLLLC